MTEKNVPENQSEGKKRLPTPAGVHINFVPDGETIKDAALLKKASFEKRAAAGDIWGTGSDTMRLPLTYVDPLFDPVLVLFPKENIRELNRRLRHYYNYHPVVGTVIDTHVEFSLCDFELSCSDPAIEKEYNDLKDRTSLHEFLMQLGRDYFLVGEAIGYGDWDDTDLTWKSFVQYPPENIEVFKTYVGPGVVYALKPDEELKRVLSSPKATDRAVAKLIPDDLKESILKGKPYILNNNNLIVLSRKPAAYIARGSSLVTRVLKYLLLEEKLLLLLFTYIDTSMFPIKLVKVGDAGKGIIPSKRQIEEIRRLLMQAQSDPSFTVVTHPFVNIDFPTPVGKFENPINLLEFVYKRILVGLMASDEFLKGSVSPYASATVSTRLVMMRYLAFRKRVENVVLNKVFKPIAVARGYSDKNGNLILPVFKWKQRNLLNEQAERELLMRLRDKQEIPFKLLCEVFNLDYEQVRKDLENEQSTVFDIVYKEAIREKSKDKGIMNEVIKGVPVPEAVKKGAELGERVTKPGRPSVLEELKAPPYIPTPTGKTAIPPRAEPLEKGTETKPVGVEKPETKPETPTETKTSPETTR
jgi:methyl coenzyme M reductase subunit D